MDSFDSGVANSETPKGDVIRGACGHLLVQLRDHGRLLPRDDKVENVDGIYFADSVK
jgi:hypothetical protein